MLLTLKKLYTKVCVYANIRWEGLSKREALYYSYYFKSRTNLLRSV